MTHSRRFTFDYFTKHPAPFQQDGSKEPPQKRNKSEQIGPDEKDLVLCAYRLLHKAPDFFQSRWQWSLFVEKFAGHGDSEIRWLACQCLATISSMSQSEKSELMSRSSLSPEDVRRFSLKYFVSDSIPELNQIKTAAVLD